MKIGFIFLLFWNLPMAFDWNGYLEFAREVQTNAGASEAHKRAAISRAYYAAYHLALRYANDHRRAGIPENTGQGSHAHTSRWYRNKTTSPDHNDVGDRLVNLMS